MRPKKAQNGGAMAGNCPHQGNMTNQNQAVQGLNTDATQ